MSFELNWFGLTLLVYLSPLIENGEVTEVVATAFGITERKEAERQIEKMAHYNNLTGLANRRLFQKKLLNELNRAFEKNKSFTIMFLDLDRFKNVNDTLGHNNDDVLLMKAADRFLKTLCQTDTAARLGGDEYAILLPSNTRKAAGLTAKQICEDVNHFFLI